MILTKGILFPVLYRESIISNSKAAGAQPLLTIPMLDWVARVGNNRSKLASFSIAKYGAQTGNDWQWYPDAGNGILASTSQYVTGNNPADANTSSNSTFQQGWVQHLVNRWGTAENGGLRHYIRGIFGREGLDMPVRWTTSSRLSQPVTHGT